MKKKDNSTENKVDRILESIDHIQRVEGNPYLYSRIRERLKDEGDKSLSFFSRKSVINARLGIVMLAILCLVNVFTIINYSSIDRSETSGISSLSEAYGWSDDSSQGIYDSIDFE